jgi:GAF domain-containing protein
VIKTGKTTVYPDVADITEMLKHPCYLNIQLRAYIGIPVLSGGRIWGTPNYSCKRPRKDEYSQQEIDFVESQARQLADLINHHHA